MKRSLFLALLVSAALVSARLVFGDTAPSTTGVKIGVVDVQRALNEVPEGKSAKASLEKEFQSKKAELDGMKKALEALGEEIGKKSQILSADALKEKKDEYQRKLMEYQQKARDYTEEMARKETELTSKIVGKLKTVVEDIAKREGYTFILEKSQGGVLYGPSSADITEEVIKQYK